MKKIFILFCFMSAFCCEISSVNAAKKRAIIRPSGNKKSGSVKNIISKTSSSGNAFSSCMDNVCKIDSDDEKGRCRCSSQLYRIEKVLRDIEKVQNEADEKNKNLEMLMNVSNTASVSDNLGSLYDNINSIENKSKKLAANKIDTRYGVIEGAPLYEEGLNQCKSYLSGDFDSLKKDYDRLIEEDCAAYTSILKEKADTATSLLTQAQKNKEMFDEQEYKKINQLDKDSCYVEYETCMKTQCGEEFTACLENAKLEANLKKCQSVNYGKCEANKSIIVVELRKSIQKAREKNKIAQSCLSAMGHIENGQCVFKVRYVADSCSIAKKCGDSQEKTFLPGYRVTCDDNRGDFKELVLGCKESCFLMGSNGEERKIGTNVEQNGGKNTGRVIGAVLTLGISLTSSNAIPGCKADGDLDRYTLPIPEGWGSDGYPVDEQLKKAF